MYFNFLDGFAEVFYSVPMNAAFHAAHFVLVSLSTRELFAAKEGKAFFKSHPLANYMLTILLSFAGSLIVNMTLGDPLVDVCKNVDSIMLASICWFLVHYSPFDLVYKLCCLPYVLIVICVIKEVQRTNNIFSGVDYAYGRYPNSVLIWIFVGAMKGCGTNQGLPCLHIFLKDGNPLRHEVMFPSYVTKVSFLVAVTHSLNAGFFNVISVEYEYLLSVMVMVTLRLFVIFTKISNPFFWLEHILCYIFFDGVTDKVSGIVHTRAQEKNKKDN